MEIDSASDAPLASQLELQPAGPIINEYLPYSKF